jgi:hypothetical protein
MIGTVVLLLGAIGSVALGAQVSNLETTMNVFGNVVVEHALAGDASSSVIQALEAWVLHPQDIIASASRLKEEEAFAQGCWGHSEHCSLATVQNNVQANVALFAVLSKGGSVVNFAALDRKATWLLPQLADLLSRQTATHGDEFKRSYLYIWSLFLKFQQGQMDRALDPESAQVYLEMSLRACCRGFRPSVQFKQFLRRLVQRGLRACRTEMPTVADIQFGGLETFEHNLRLLNSLPLERSKIWLDYDLPYEMRQAGVEQLLLELDLENNRCQPDEGVFELDTVLPCVFKWVYAQRGKFPHKTDRQFVQTFANQFVTFSLRLDFHAN